MDTERMSRVDTSWLRMDSDVNLMVIVGVWMLEPKVSLDAVRRRCVDDVVAGACELGWREAWRGVSGTPGTSGNIEYFVQLVHHE